jgi:hypothetical protein
VAEVAEREVAVGPEEVEEVEERAAVVPRAVVAVRTETPARAAKPVTMPGRAKTPLVAWTAVPEALAALPRA